MSKRRDTYYLLSLGCAKNTVDSQSMEVLLNGAGLHNTTAPDRAEVLIVNTCGFIAAAREESVKALRDLAAHKRPGQLLIAAGCLSQRNGHDLARQVPGLDGVIGTRRWMDIVDLVHRLRARNLPQPLYHLPDEARTVGTDERGVSRVAVQGASAYLKIADGCRRPCAFCAIPAIKGTAVSRPTERVVAEAQIAPSRTSTDPTMRPGASGSSSPTHTVRPPRTRRSPDPSTTCVGHPAARNLARRFPTSL